MFGLHDAGQSLFLHIQTPTFCLFMKRFGTLLAFFSHCHSKMVGFFVLLPAEVASLILDNVISRKDLYHCTLVNKWFYANTVARLWRAPLLKGISGPRRMFEGFLSAQQHRYLMLGDHIRTLSMDYHPMADVTIESLVVYTPFLERLELFSSFGLVIPAPLGLVWRSCPRLEEVYLNDVLLDNLTSLARNCPHIRRLEFRRFSGVNDNIFQPLLTLDNLTDLIFVDFKWINSDLITSNLSAPPTGTPRNRQ
jgi:hypothetical protein